MAIGRIEIGILSGVGTVSWDAVPVSRGIGKREEPAPATKLPPSELLVLDQRHATRCSREVSAIRRFA